VVVVLLKEQQLAVLVVLVVEVMLELAVEITLAVQEQ
jgi:hypothetical protein